MEVITTANRKLGLTLVAYPESLPPDWVAKLDLMGIGYSWALHDKDVETDGTPKKPHIHIFFQASLNAKQKKYVGEVTGIKFHIDVQSPEDMYEYLTHENDENKYHYDKSIIHHSAAWSQEAFEMLCNQYKRPQRISIYDIYMTIEENNITDLRALNLYYMSNFPDDERNQYLNYISRKGYALKEYLYQKKQTMKPKEDKL